MATNVFTQNGLDSLNTDELDLHALANPEKFKDDSYATSLDASPAFSASSGDSDVEDIGPSVPTPAFNFNTPLPMPSAIPATPSTIPAMDDSQEGSEDMDSDSAESDRVAPAPYVKPTSKIPLSADEERKRKFELLYKIKALAKKGIPQPIPVDMTTCLDNIELAYDEMYESYKRQNSVKLQGKMLVMAATFVEFMNARFDPFDFRLSGWSESVYEGVSSQEYDEVLEELYEKYKSNTKMAPEVKLMMMLGGSAFMHHTLASTFSVGMGAGTQSTSAAPKKDMAGPSGLDDILNNFKKTA